MLNAAQVFLWFDSKTVNHYRGIFSFSKYRDGLQAFTTTFSKLFYEFRSKKKSLECLKVKPNCPLWFYKLVTLWIECKTAKKTAVANDENVASRLFTFSRKWFLGCNSTTSQTIQLCLRYEIFTKKLYSFGRKLCIVNKDSTDGRIQWAHRIGQLVLEVCEYGVNFLFELLI